ncbi:hypothetical protein MSAN_02112600 [Mycena sanguinolenta]|uniref:Uncharacterized protein n=1 Tax=Mycena sanguinolenta TaxID=230812 RepID=A0A8H6XGW9_9AGAR|nr:hypothetical protein MSAN_02112600 [Mycena sanguinolenta]
MSIPSAAIIDLATPISRCDTPVQVRNRLEWTWGLGYDHLDEHLQEFDDPQSLLTDETVLVFPHNDILQQLFSRNMTGKLGLYNGHKSFEYLVLPTDAASPLPPRIVTSELPPHLALCTTFGKMLKAWGKLPGWDANLVSVVERAKAVPHTSRPPLEMWQLTQMDNINRKWTWGDYVPPSFMSADSDQTMVEPEEEHPTAGNAKRKSTSSNFQASSSSSGSRHEPKRRLLPSEFESPPVFAVECDADEDDDDDAISHDSYISGVEGDPEEFAKASVARGDYEVDPRWLKGDTALGKPSLER